MKIVYNLSICFVDGVTIYNIISSDKKLLMNFLDEHDHEGSSIYLTRKSDDIITTIDNPEQVYKELGMSI